MNCPHNCPTPLVIAERHGIEIDYCPTCRGVWLDKGELDKVIERGAAYEAQPPRPQAPAPSQPTYAPPIPQAPMYERDRHYDDDDDYRRRKKKKGFLGEIFDFD
ncbi:MAG TPA: zf-TFIIB domain-containing protein [Fimbriimonadaceae bacterium]|nr:zf-TFIIB domain-containing protein [Fimbriimonadaceae bacterium]